jgi:MFS family permease
MVGKRDAIPPGRMTSHDPYAALRLADYRRYFVGNFASNFGLQMQTTAVGWDIYQRTDSTLALGMAGLIQFLPVITLFLLAGHAADRFSRKWIILIAQIVVAASSLGLALISWTHAHYGLIYVCLAAVGIARAFQQPAKSALLPLLVPTEHFSNAVTWNSSGFHLASVLGPAAGGLMIKLTESPVSTYMLDAIAAGVFVGALLGTRVRPMDHVHRALSFEQLSAGFRFVWHHQIVLGALALDLFAVLLGGAVTLLPTFARDILHVGPSGLGWLRTAPAMGALLMAIVLAHRPPLTRAGLALLWSVAGFGIATIVFGLSTNFALSMVMLFLTGALDNISVVIRHTLVQTLTPDALRGRVSAVNSLFIGASNELGGFESGLVAYLFTPQVSVVSGGVGTVLVVILTALALPKLRDYDRLGAVAEDEQAEGES